MRAVIDSIVIWSLQVDHGCDLSGFVECGVLDEAVWGRGLRLVGSIVTEDRRADAGFGVGPVVLFTRQEVCRGR
jgi:hypothetical protein